MILCQLACHCYMYLWYLSKKGCELVTILCDYFVKTKSQTHCDSVIVKFANSVNTYAHMYIHKNIVIRSMSRVVYSSHKGSQVFYAVVREQFGSCLLSSIIRDSPLVRKQYTRTVCYSMHGSLWFSCSQVCCLPSLFQWWRFHCSLSAG